jgi:hypothetical protein
MRRPTLRFVASVAALSPASLVLSHNLAFLVAFGRGAEDALRATGHDEGWASAVRFVLAISTMLGLATVVRISYLWRTARRLERDRSLHPRTDWRQLARTVLALWAVLAVVTAGWFVAQENLERLAIGGSLPGIEPLLEGGPAGPLLIIPLVSLIVAFIGGLFRWGITALRARIAAAKAARVRQQPARIRRPVDSDARRSGVLSRHVSLRAPPGPLAG